MPRAYSTIDTSVYDAGDRLSLRNVIARASLTRKRRREDDDDDDDDDLFDAEELSEILKAPRNTWPRPGASNRHGRPDYDASTWGRMLRDPGLSDPNSSSSKVFRSRFRVPYPIFLLLLDWVKGWHEKNKTDASSRARVPTDLKLLGVLRILGRATVFDGINELSGIAVSTMQSFFHLFTSKARNELYPKHVFTPRNREEVIAAEAAYKLLGLPGAIGSMDVVHVAWGCAPTALANLAKGKEGYPTVAYNVICNHDQDAMAVTKSALGATNDKTIVRFDDEVNAIRTDKFFTDFEYEIRTGPSDEDREMATDAHLITDGGYHKWSCTQAASKLCSDPGYAEWRKQMESVRKEIEVGSGGKMFFKCTKISPL